MNMSEEKDIIDLGFVEECPSGFLTNRYCPSKVGGKPAWLDLKNIPKTQELECEKCNNPRVLLCQVYAPDENNDECYRRMIYIFMCRNPDCNKDNCSKNFVVFRNQLRADNEFYGSLDSPDDENEEPALASPIPLCLVCGCRGSLSCSQCKKARYCCKNHQKVDWKHHKLNCKANSSDLVDSPPSTILFPEFELVMESEPETEKTETEEEAEVRRSMEAKQLEKENEGVFKDLPESEISKYAFLDTTDKTFKKFMKRIERSPEQVLRYQRNAEPLWITKPDSEIEIPNCENCGGQRTFEFQIMPRLLEHLKDTNLYWGVLAVYTCKNDCSSQERHYLKEFLIRQDDYVFECK